MLNQFIILAYLMNFIPMLCTLFIHGANAGEIQNDYSIQSGNVTNIYRIVIADLHDSLVNILNRINEQLSDGQCNAMADNSAIPDDQCTDLRKFFLTDSLPKSPTSNITAVTLGQCNILERNLVNEDCIINIIRPIINAAQQEENTQSQSFNLSWIIGLSAVGLLSIAVYFSFRQGINKGRNILLFDPETDTLDQELLSLTTENLENGDYEEIPDGDDASARAPSYS